MWFTKLTICGQLHKRLLLTDEELNVDGEYNRQTFGVFFYPVLFLYILIASPAVFLMTKSGMFSVVMSGVVRKLWINRQKRGK